MIREADRLSPAAADTLLKVLEEPPADAVFLLMSARAHELPDTVLSRCHVVTFTALVRGVRRERPRHRRASTRRRRPLAARLAGGNLGRARRLAVSADGLRSAKPRATRSSSRRRALPAGSPPPTVVLDAAAEYKKNLKGELDEELAPFMDEKGRPEDAYRGAIKRIETRFKRKERRAERDYVDWVLLAVSALLRDRIAAGVGVRAADLLNPDLAPGDVLGVTRAAKGLAGDRGRPRRARRRFQPQRRGSCWSGPSCRWSSSPPDGASGASTITLAHPGLLQQWCWHSLAEGPYRWDAGRTSEQEHQP